MGMGFDIVDVVTNEISFKTEDGERLLFNKKMVDELLRKQEEERQ